MERQSARLVETYRNKVLSRQTRRIILLGRKCEPHIFYSFLGFELKMARKRITCPDMGTARYLKVFAEIGMPAVEIPYDPTRTSRLLNDLEQPLQRIKELLLEEQLSKREHQLRLRKLYQDMRRRLLDAERSTRLGTD